MLNSKFIFKNPECHPNSVQGIHLNGKFGSSHFKKGEIQIQSNTKVETLTVFIFGIKINKINHLNFISYYTMHSLLDHPGINTTINTGTNLRIHNWTLEKSIT